VTPEEGWRLWPERHTVVTAPVRITQHVTTRMLAREDVARRVTTTRTRTVRESIVAAPAVATTAAGAPLYIVPRYYNFVAPPAPHALRAKPATPRGIAPAVSATAPVVAVTSMPAYRYIYEPDRIVVIDPSSNIAVQAIPR
jgi:hypothetical protein